MIWSYRPIRFRRRMKYARVFSFMNSWRDSSNCRNAHLFRRRNNSNSVARFRNCVLLEWVRTLIQEKKDCFVRLSQLRREISEVENAIQVSKVIIDAKNRGETITPDHVRRQTVKMKEDCYGSIRRKHSRQVGTRVLLHGRCVQSRIPCA